MKPDRPEDAIAVLQVICDSESDGLVRVHISVPYVSVLHMPRYPAFVQAVLPQFHASISNVIFDFHTELGARGRTSPRIGTASYADIQDPAPCESHSGYRDSIVAKGRQITEDLKLERIVDFLMELRGKVRLLQIFTDIPEIPWDWLSDKHGRLLLEEFGIGVTTPESIKILGVMGLQHDRAVPIQDLRSDRYSAVVIGNSYTDPKWNQLPLKCELPWMDMWITELTPVVQQTFGTADSFIHREVKQAKIRELLAQQAAQLRFMFISGHFGHDGFRAVDGYFGADDVHAAFEETDGVESFGAEPVIILNGCNSGGQSGGVRGLTNKALAQAFMERGAGACIFTSAPIRIEWGMKFVQSFLHAFLEPGASIGNSLLVARKSLDWEKAYEIGCYHLLGDPTYVMVKEERAEQAPAAGA